MIDSLALAPRTNAAIRPWRNLRQLALALSLAAYFLCFNWGSLRVHFPLDGLGNISYYHEFSSWRLILSNFLPWRGDSRPLGALYYIPIFHFAGLNPLPYQAVLLAILLANVYWVYRFARELGAGEVAAGLAALVSCYHAGIANLYYNAAFVFDALCCFFYLATLVYYLRVRNRGHILSTPQTAIFLLLFLCALNSKEMAVSVPPMVLVYEWIYHRPANWTTAALLTWIKGPARVSLIAGVLDLLDIYGKVSGPTAMTNSISYHPVFTLARIHDFQRLAMQELFCSWAWTPGWRQILELWAVLALLAWWNARRRPVLPFLFWFLILVPLPIEFLIGKSEACLVLLMVGGAIFVAVLFADAVEAFAHFLAREFRLPAVGRPLVVALMVSSAVFLWVREQRSLRLSIGGAPMTSLGFESWDLIQQMRASSFRPRPGSSVAILEDPFVDRLDMYRIGRLWLRDRTVNLHVAGQGPLSPEALAKMDYVFTIENRKLIQLK